MPDGQLDARDLVLAAVAADRWRKAHPDLESYFTRRYELLHDALGARHELRSSVDAECTGAGCAGADHFDLEATMRDSVHLVNSVPNPFEGILEASDGISDLYRRFGGRVYGAAAELRNALIDVALDVLLQFEPALADKTTNEETLLLAGLPREAPEFLEY